MKSILSFVIALSFASVVWAQDETESPAASPEENSSSSSMQAPSSLREAPQSSATPESKPTVSVETAKPTPTPAALPTREKKKSTAESDEEPAPKATKSEGPDKGKPESVVKRLENEWEMSVMKHDTAFVESRVAKDFMGVSSKGKRLNKAALLKEYKTDTDTYSSAKNGSLNVRAADKNVVIASGTAKEIGKSKDGEKFTRSYLFTDTWVMRGDRWECVASHVMLASGKE